MRVLSLKIDPPGPVAAAFMASNAPVRLIMGPVGGGKTSTALVDHALRAVRVQKPSTIDGIRKYKFAVVRDTYRNLMASTIPTWLSWFPREMGSFSGDGPIVHRLPIVGLNDGTSAEIIAEFIGLGEHRVETVMRGWEGTAAFLDEADTLIADVLTYVSSRVGRYPAMREGGPTWSGVTLAMNAPDTENWTYVDFVEAPKEGYAFFRQPSGFSPQAENLANLPPDYYRRLAIGKEEWWIRRFVRNEFGYSRDGRPVYPEFNDALHVAAEPLRPDDAPLRLGLDAGLSPAAVITQRRPNGQWRVTDEIVTEQGTGPTRFADGLTRMLAERYKGLKVTAHADPSAAYGADTKAGERTWIETVAHVTGFKVAPAPTNGLIPRLEAVRVSLTRLIDGHVPGFLLSPSCRALRKGFNATYRYRRVNVPGAASYGEAPDKNDASHPHDALQYAMLAGGEYQEITGRKRDRERARAETAAHASYDELA